MTLENETAKVKIGGSMSDSFNIDSVVRQGDTLSATLFNNVIHEAVNDTIKTRSIINKSWQICAYADD
jgi:diphthamide biosynthesis methyltransferase